MRVLLSNDDGVHAVGLKYLYEALKKHADVTVFAPLEEKSTTGHSLTIHQPLRIVPMGGDFYGVNGSPADCVYLAMHGALKHKPDMIVSGINRGANMGQDIYYSGTVSAAREATMRGLPALAVSLDVDFHRVIPDHKLHYESAAHYAAIVFKEMQKHDLPRYTLMNLNVPDIPLSKVKGVRLARQGYRHYSGKVIRRMDHRGKNYFWVGGRYLGHEKIPDTDGSVVASGYCSLTPMKLDVTDLDCLASWSASCKSWGCK